MGRTTGDQMSAGFTAAISAMPFFDLLDLEEERLATQIVEAEDDRAASAAMDASRRRLAQGVDAFVRGLPAAIRHDANTSRAAAYALVGLADERMLHHPAGGLERWRDRLLEFELYGSALAGQEIVHSAQSASQGRGPDFGQALLGSLYLALFREGFEGSLRGDLMGLSALIASLEDALDVAHDRQPELAGSAGPTRIGVSPVPLAIAGLTLWLGAGFMGWLVLASDSLGRVDRIAERIEAGVPFRGDGRPGLDRSVGPSNLPPLEAPAEPDRDRSGEDSMPSATRRR